MLYRIKMSVSTTIKLRQISQHLPKRSYSNDAPKLPPCNFQPKKYKGPNLETLKSIRKSRLIPSLTTIYNTPLPLHQGHMQWVFDITGKRYLDLFGGICTVSVGHCHKKVNEAAEEQMKILGHCSNIYMHPKIHEYAEKLTDKMPGDLKVVYFVNSGSEANDLAILLARAYTKNFEIISLMNSYHGMSYQTMGLTSTSVYKYNVPQPAGIRHAMNPDVFRGPWGGANCRDSPIQTNRHCVCNSIECEAKDNYVEQLRNVFRFSLPKKHVAGFFAESIQGVGGTVQFPKGYLKAAYDMIKEEGGVYIADEVQTGFGRTGDHFWGFEMHGVHPDIVTMAKGIGNGYPLAAVVTTPEIAQAMAQSSHFNTYGGNPVGCAVGMAVLDAIEEDKCQEVSKTIGTYFLHELSNLQFEFGVLGDVRGKGLMIGMELVSEKGLTNPLPTDKFMQFYEECRDMGLLLGRGGYFGNVIRIKPPMCISKEDVDFAIAVIRKSLKNISS